MIEHGATVTLTLYEWRDMLHAIKFTTQSGAVIGPYGTDLRWLETVLESKIEEED